MKKIINIFVLLLVLIFVKKNLAVNMDSTKYSIKSGNLNIGAKPESSSSYKLTTTMGQTSAGVFSSNGYVVKAGFQYIYSIIPFTFTISQTKLDFGKLVPNAFSNATTDLTVSFGSAGSYQVTAIEETPMKTMFNKIIPDTNCNGGVNVCDENTANLWDDVNTYGFGYKITGEDIPDTYSSCVSSYGTECFRRLPDLNSSEDPVVVMSNLNVTGNTDPTLPNKHKATVGFKINVSPIQEAGSYQTIINFVATPGF